MKKKKVEGFTMKKKKKKEEKKQKLTFKANV